MKKAILLYLFISSSLYIYPQNFNKGVIGFGTSYDRLRVSNDPNAPQDYPTNEVLVDFELGFFGKRDLLYNIRIGGGHAWGGVDVGRDIYYIRQDIFKFQLMVKKYYEIIPIIFFGTQLELYGTSADAWSI